MVPIACSEEESWVKLNGAGGGAERLSKEELGILEERDRWAVGGRRT